MKDRAMELHSTHISKASPQKGLTVKEGATQGHAHCEHTLDEETKNALWKEMNTVEEPQISTERTGRT